MPNNALNRWIIDSATDFAIIATDRRGKVTAWNEGARLTLGWTEAEMLGEPVDRIFTPDDLAIDRPAFEMQCALETGVGTDERWHLRKNGERFWANGEMTVLRDDVGGAIGFVKVLRDRTEQRLATETLRGGQANIRLLLDSMIEGFYAVDTDGVTTVCNAAFLRMMGFEKEEDAVGRKLHDIIHGQHPDGSHYDVAECPIYVCARDGTRAHVRGELFFPVNGGEPVPVEYWAVPIAPGGDHQGAMCTFIEITEEQNASERLKLALDTGAIVGTWFWDVLADTFIADDRFADSLGLSREACRAGLRLDDVLDTVHPDDRARVDDAMAAAMKRGGAYRCEYRVRQRDGVFRWIEANGRVETDAAGQAIQFPGVLLDIEARRAAEAERDSATEMLRSFTEAVPGVVYAKDRDGRLLIGNRGTTELFGKPPENYIGKTDLELLDDKEQALQVMANDRRIMESGESEQTEEEVRLADGTPATWLSTKSPVFNAAGEVVGIVGSSVDVTARIEAEAAIQELNRTLEERIVDAIAERQTIEEALRQIAEDGGGRAADRRPGARLQQPADRHLGQLELMQTRDRQGRLDDVDRYITAAQGAAKRAAALTHRLLAFSRRQTLDPKPTDVNRLVAGMEELIRRTVGPAITSRWSARRAVAGAVDPAQLENALLNLCINARDAMPDGGRITIETANKWLDERAARSATCRRASTCRVCVTDTGTGMSPDVDRAGVRAVLHHQADRPGHRARPLDDLRLRQQSGGQVRIYSEVGQGTTVCIYLPRHYGERGDERRLSRPRRPRPRRARRCSSSTTSRPSACW